MNNHTNLPAFPPSLIVVTHTFTLTDLRIGVILMVVRVVWYWIIYGVKYDMYSVIATQVAEVMEKMRRSIMLSLKAVFEMSSIERGCRGPWISWGSLHAAKVISTSSTSSRSINRRILIASTYISTSSSNTTKILIAFICIRNLQLLQCCNHFIHVWPELGIYWQAPQGKVGYLIGIIRWILSFKSGV